MKFLGRRAARGVAVAAVGALALAGVSGCAGGAGEGEVREITVSINPSSQFAPLYYGIDQGIFEEHGLDPEIVPQTDIAAIISGIASGQYDFGFATVVHVINANLSEIPIRAVSSIEGQLSADDEGTTLVAGADSGIEEIADLEGKTLGTIGLSSLNTLTTWALADEAGIDPKSIELVQMPFGQMPAALDNGDVDAAVLQHPFVTQATDQGAKVLAYNNAELFADSATTLFNTSQTFIDQNPDVVEAFNEAMVASQEAASTDPEAARAALAEGMELTDEEAADAHWNVGGKPQLSLKSFEVAQDLLMDFAGQSKRIEETEMVWQGALE